MDSFLLGEYPECNENLHDFQYNSELFPNLSAYNTYVSNFNDEDLERFNFIDSGVVSENPSIVLDSGENPDGWIDELSGNDDFPDDCLKFITEILMEEDIDDQTVALEDYTALKATEQSLLEALGEHVDVPTDSFDSFNEFLKGQADSPASTLLDSYSTESILVENGSRGRKNNLRGDDDDTDYEEGRRNKHLAAYEEEYVEMEQFDDVLLCNVGEDDFSDSGTNRGGRRSSKKKTRGKKKKNSEAEAQVVDLRGLLTQCAQAVANFDLRNANELLGKIKEHASKYGDSTQRLAFYFANGLEARLAGTGWAQYKEEMSRRVPSSDILKAYKAYVSAIPFKRTSYFMANDAITKLAENSTRIHIIDFGIFFGFQWPGLIKKLAQRKGGPPVLRITGIDYPQSGFRPAKRIEETGRRLAGYCERFGVPFVYQPIAKRWQDVTIDELNIDKDEALVVNCLYMVRKLLDETVDETNPRDTFFKLVRKLNPTLFIHGIVNGIYNGPFFETRFREAMFHYSAIFDLFEATVPRESEERLLGEGHLYGADALNVIACEGKERIERPETYRQWQCRLERAGFRKLVLDNELVHRVQAAFKGNYHKDFVVYESSHWLLQGWKGRILYAISCWTSA
ncbi:scarecrow-like protein 30 [Silene latifolia]|uniref:scarecrow-like protein 30 n=1 Tax=Silene latifolia TaxID=37657 RepID=UPI003D7737BB